MVKILAIFLLFSVQASFAHSSDDIYSIYFEAASKPGTKKLTQIAERFHHEYTLEEQDENSLRTAAGDHLIVDETGVYIQKNKLLSISRTEIRENSKFSINGGYLHGLLPNDSVMVALEGDAYYFLIPKKSYLFEVGGTDARLYQGLTASDFLILSTESNGYCSALYISFSANKVALQELNYEQKELDFRTVTHTKLSSEKIPLYLLNPSKKEWQQLMEHFTPYDSYRVDS